MSVNKEWQRLIAPLSLVCLLLVGWFLYAPALGGAFLLDDMYNLKGLASIRDAASALQFILTGPAGPLGRPLALASFVPQAGDWSATARPFIRVNVLIHLFNGLLAYIFFRQLARIVSADNGGSKHWLALAAALLWLLSPLLASSSLMVIQRMTTMAAACMLLGFIGYLYFRSRLPQRPNVALAGMSASIVLATLLAVLCKENGALLPALVLVIEATLSTRPASINAARWRAWWLTCLGLPVAAVAIFVATRIPYDPVTVLERDFTAVERLMTEAKVLWTYVFNALVPMPGAFGPFHDDYPVARSLLDPVTLIASLAWVLTLAAAVVCRRRQQPLAAFAILWFLAAHWLESTTVPLYLYFEHRNYVPLLGPAFAIASAVFAVRGRYAVVARGLLTGAIAAQALVLLQLTSLWGNPPQAAARWHAESPASAAAASHFAEQQLATIGPAAGVETLRTFALEHAEHAYFRVPEITATCSIAPEQDQSKAVAYLLRALPTVDYMHNMGTMFDELLGVIVARQCPGIDVQSFRQLLDAVLDNPRYAANPDYLSYHHQLLASLAYTAGDSRTAVEQLRVAQSWRNNDAIYLMLVTALVQASDYAAARTVIADGRNSLSPDPRKRIATKLLLDELEHYVEALEASDR